MNEFEDYLIVVIALTELDPSILKSSKFLNKNLVSTLKLYILAA